MTAPESAASSTRGRLLRSSGAGLAASAVLLSGCGGKSSRPGAPRIGGADAARLNGLLDLKHRTIGAYTAGIPLLAGGTLSAAQRFLGQELSHADELSGLVKRTGAVADRPSDSYDFGHPRSAVAVLRLLHAAETAQLAAYIAVIPRLVPGASRAAAASILADDAQHVAVLRSALALDPVPSAFVTGRE